MLKGLITALPIILPWVLFALTLATLAWKAATWKATTPTAEAVKVEVAALYQHCRDERTKIKTEWRQAQADCKKDNNKDLERLGNKVDELTETTARLDERLQAFGGVSDRLEKNIKRAEDIMREILNKQIGGLGK